MRREAGLGGLGTHRLVNGGQLSSAKATELGGMDCQLCPFKLKYVTANTPVGFRKMP